MGKVQHFREQARRCRALAAEQPDSKHVQRWLMLASSYDKAADQLERRSQAVANRLVRPSRITPVQIARGRPTT
jgi:hypothetical protein